MIDTTPFLTSGQYSEHQKSSSMGQDDLGRDAFLTLLTTQLTNQNPLEPMDNEAFVAQLAQFSTVEGIKGMQGSLEDMASGVRQEQMMSGANLVGKKVAVQGGLFTGGNGQPSQGSINLPVGADSVVVSVYDAQTGDLIFRETQGSKMPGNNDLSWNGEHTDGSPAPEGSYVMTANVVKDGNSQTAAVTTFATVNSVKWNPSTQQLSLDIGNGTYVPLSAVEAISG